MWGASEVENLNILTANLEKLYQKSIAGYKKADYMFLLEKMPPPLRGAVKSLALITFECMMSEKIPLCIPSIFL